MNPIESILPLAHVVLDTEASSRKQLFEQIGRLFEEHQGIARGPVFDSLFARERLGSTALGQGIAIPHGRVKGLREATGAFVRLRTPLPFDAPDGQPVSLLFVLLVPEQANETHLHMLSTLAQLFADAALRAALQGAGTPAEARGVLVDAVSNTRP
ncbi:PTS sugar transporter subunit IIA [Pseudothauera nasutitermitis]|uniref:PTS sugar transporter subunit IIA n=1 Tax=Pseudothauera nasutitermitis TaxID=2565930 RepID=A0A4S4AV52_9RHOO|nr:PTS sugar transporter subunit IIA [Pseudothauera nasutitermitis]THF62416.1 PTS sugar transporter subunit IIA [Pseudothauera nasutitermitis]